MGHSHTEETVKPCFSIYFSSQNRKKATECTEELQCVHNKSKTKLNTSICFMHITCKKKSTANLKLTGNLIILPDTSTLVYGKLCWLTWLQNQEASGLKQWLFVSMLSGTEQLVSHITTQILIRTYKLRTANKTLQPLCIFISRNPWHPFVEHCGSAECSM